MGNACSKSADEIRQEMVDIRSNLDFGMDRFVEKTRVLMDWHYYIRSAPWLCAGAAALAGYLLVPSKTRVVRPDADQIAELVKNHQLVLNDMVQAKPKTSLAATLAGVAGSFVLRAGMAAASEHVRRLIQQTSGGGPR